MPARKVENDDSPEAKRRKREEFEREQAERNRTRDAARRHMFTSFRLWTACTDKRCMRAHACRGDIDTCMKLWHAVVPPELKALLQKFFAYMGDGYTREEALDAAQRDMQSHLQAQRKLDEHFPPKTPAASAALPASIARHMSTAPSVPETSTPPTRRSGPRIWSV